MLDTKEHSFGRIAVRKGLVSEEALRAALEIQKEQRSEGEPTLIGIILLRMGAISSTQLIEVVLEMRKLAGARNDDA